MLTGMSGIFFLTVYIQVSLTGINGLSEAAFFFSFSNGIRERGGVKVINTIIEKMNFFSDGQSVTAVELKGGGVKALMALPLKKMNFLDMSVVRCLSKKNILVL